MRAVDDDVREHEVRLHTLRVRLRREISRQLAIDRSGRKLQSATHLPCLLAGLLEIECDLRRRCVDPTRYRPFARGTVERGSVTTFADATVRAESRDAGHRARDR